MTIVSNILQGAIDFRWYVAALAVAMYLAMVYGEHYRLKDFKRPWLSGWSSLWLLNAIFNLRTLHKFARVCENKVGDAP
jgi:hypothetical protein